jgi:hypothetical protein
MILIQNYSYLLGNINGWKKIKMVAKNQDGVKWTISSTEILLKLHLVAL